MTERESDWGEQARDMMSAWAEAQQRAWSAWSTMAAGAPPGGPGRRGEGGPRRADPMRAWQRMAERATRAWTVGADPTARDVASRIVESQQTAMRFAGVLTDAWQETMSQMAGGADAAAWQRSLERFGERLRTATVVGPSAFDEMAGDSADLWEQYLDALGRVAEPWVEMLQRSPGHIGEALAGDRSELLELSRLYWDAWERTGGRLLESPSLGFTRELEEKMLRGFDSWVDYRQRVLEYQVVFNEAWADAVEAVIERLRDRASSGEPVESVEELFTLWTDTTDEVLDRAFRSERYARVQGKMVNAAMRYRQRERDVVETFLKMTDIPARSELDQAFKDLYALRREVRELRSELEAVRTERSGRDAESSSDNTIPGGAA